MYKHTYWIFLAAVVLSLAAIAWCKQDISWVRDLEHCDYSMVRCGRAPAGLKPLAPAGEIKKHADLIRDYLLGNQPLLQAIAKQRPGTEQSALGDFKMSGVWADTAQGRLMVQFFAQYRRPQVYAGRRLQFLMDTRHHLEAIYVDDVPLER